MTIFIQIAAYRDTELGPTIRDCIAKAKWPEDLRFGICLQDDLTEDYGVDFTDSRIRLKRVHWRDSQGVCWARSQTQELYDGETFTLQIDSHHRFTQHWDKLLIQDLERCNTTKPILSTYPASYYPETGRRGLGAPNKILISRFGQNGSLKRYPLGYKASENQRPIPARFIAAGFLFTTGRFCQDIPYDPNLYFAAEEPNLTVRAFTHGYELFHPQQNVLWHEYVRDDKPKHWFDHAEPSKIINSTDNNKITEREADDMRRFNAMLKEPKDTGLVSKLGLGSVRSVHDYERFAGLDFQHQVVHQATRLGQDPITQSEKDWQAANQLAINKKQRLKSWFTKIDLSGSEIELQKAKVGIVTYYDRDKQMIDRVTINNQVNITDNLLAQSLSASAPPAYWVLTGFTQSNTWEQIRTGVIHDYRLLA